MGRGTEGWREERKGEGEKGNERKEGKGIFILLTDLSPLLPAGNKMEQSFCNQEDKSSLSSMQG